MKKGQHIYFSAGIGNILEFYDFALFGFYAQVFSTLYFPLKDPLNALLLSFTVFAVGFLCRPLGAIIFGWLADKFSRKMSLSYSLIGIGFATLGIAVLPPYESWGIFSPLCLAFFRIVQGISIGGEWSNSLVLVSEHLKKYRASHPAFVTGTVTAMGVLGWFLASFLCSIFRTEGWSLFSWRLPFAFGSLVALIGYYIRKKIDDPFEGLKKETFSIVKSFFCILQYKKAGLKVFSIAALMGVIFYGQFIFNNSFLPKVTALSSQTVSRLVSLGIFCYMVFLPVVGWLSDRFGHKITMIGAASGCTLCGPLIFYLQFSGGFSRIILTQISSAFFLAMLMAPGTYVLSTAFPTRIRSLGVSISYNLGATLFGGLTPTLYLLFYKHTGSLQGMPLFFSSIALLCGIVYFKVGREFSKEAPNNIEELFFKTQPFNTSESSLHSITYPFTNPSFFSSEEKVDRLMKSFY